MEFGREITGDLNIAQKREWLVTNGLGSYGSGTVAGSIARGYHGLLVAALRPPIDRRVMLVKLDETVSYLGQSYELGANRWGGDVVSPKGFTHIERFELEGSIPKWQYAFSSGRLVKRIWMVQGEHTTYVSYTHASGNGPMTLLARVIVDNRGFHNTGMIAWPINVETQPNGLKVISGGDDAAPLTLISSGGNLNPQSAIFRNYELPMEAVRGLNDLDSHSHAADFEIKISPGETVLFAGSAESDPIIDTQALDARRDRDRWLLEKRSRVSMTGSGVEADWIERLILAADQFVVERPSDDQPNGKSIVAGYQWFEDWGRDTMISLHGLTLVTGRSEDAAPILRTFAHYVDKGMLPNRFPDASDSPEYNTIDATLWYFQAILEYWESSQDKLLLADLFPILENIIEWHIKGTRYGIVMDPSDGLLRGGESGQQLTWMDARVGDHVITPRIGKPIEVNALWYNALCAMARFSTTLKKGEKDYAAMADATRKGFQRFWNGERSFCFDVLDGPNGHENLLRPNQLLAISLPECPLNPDQQSKVLEVCGDALLTSYGLRSLAKGEQGYVGSYAGDQFHRDSSYHQGTVWGWLIGPFVLAHLRVHKDPVEAMKFLEPFSDHLKTAGLGTISEIFDGDEPFEPRGCIAQAWSVGQVLSAYDRIARMIGNKSEKSATT